MIVMVICYVHLTAGERRQGDSLLPNSEWYHHKAGLSRSVLRLDGSHLPKCAAQHARLYFLS
jgi:hypothetical protein